MMKEKRYAAIKRWLLTEVKTIYERDSKAVYSADSAEYGPVIVKINRDRLQLAEEYTMLHRLNGSGCCRSYAYDKEQGILLEERLIPGTVLREEEALHKRINAFKAVFSQIHCEDMGQESGIGIKEGQAPNYQEWLEDIWEFCRENDVDAELAGKAKRARDICVEMFEKYPERLLLHGDLHHDNILLRADGSYAMIDPKGVIGPEIFDLPRYIMNEIDTRHTTPDEGHMREVIRLISEMFHYPLEDVIKLYFMEVILGNIWCLEDGEAVNSEEIAVAAKILNDVMSGSI